MRTAVLLLFGFFQITLIAQPDPLQQILESHPDLFKKVISHPENYQPQIIYTQIDRDERNRPFFKSYTFGLDEPLYFYPASTVKLPTALAALEKLNSLNIIGLDKNAVMWTGKGSDPQTPATTDTTAPNGQPSVAHYIKKILLVSDNDAQNRLYKFVGQAQLERILDAKGFQNHRIVHRLGDEGVPFNPETNTFTNPVRFLKDGKILYHQGEVQSKFSKTLNLKNTSKGVGFYRNGELVQEPFDFSKKNFLSLKTLHDILIRVLFPENFSPKERFNLTEEDYRFLYRYMSLLPRESDIRQYHSLRDNYVKFLLFGDQPTDTIPLHIRIFNKVGDAYGFLIDAAYVVDFQNNVEFILAVTLLCNEDGIFNDDQYDYETIGYPFLGNLGGKVYEYELKRPRKYAPDLSKFKNK